MVPRDALDFALFPALNVPGSIKRHIPIWITSGLPTTHPELGGDLCGS